MWLENQQQYDVRQLMVLPFFTVILATETTIKLLFSDSLLLKKSFLAVQMFAANKTPSALFLINP